MKAVDPQQLEALYARGDDPWEFRTSPYERAKFRATCAALLCPAYSSVLELGCGNGELARRLASRSARYTGLDAVETALAAARKAVPNGRFVQDYLPCDLPGGDHDLIVVSEVLYFLDTPGLAALAWQIARRWPQAEIVAVNWLGPSGNALQGEQALAAFAERLSAHISSPVVRTERYRIDRFVCT
jgi:SAM-dependent methyltransferase